MRRLLFPAFVAVIVCSQFCPAFAEEEIFWDPQIPLDGEITEKDFTLKMEPPIRAKTMGEMEVYDEPVEEDGEGDLEEALAPMPAAVPAPAPPPTVAPRDIRPAPRDVAPATPRPISPPTPTPTITPRSGVGPGQRGSQSVERAVKPEEKTPAASSVQPNVGDQPPAPGAKKMEWGKTEVKSVEPKADTKQQKFKWGTKGE